MTPQEPGASCRAWLFDSDLDMAVSIACCYIQDPAKKAEMRSEMEKYLQDPRRMYLAALAENADLLAALRRLTAERNRLLRCVELWAARLGLEGEPAEAMGRHILDFGGAELELPVQPGPRRRGGVDGPAAACGGEDE